MVVKSKYEHNHSGIGCGVKRGLLTGDPGYRWARWMERDTRVFDAYPCFWICRHRCTKRFGEARAEMAKSGFMAILRCEAASILRLDPLSG